MEVPVVVESGPNPSACVVWLHGLGADGHDFESIVPELGLPPELSIRFVFPHAPVIPVTINGGYRMRAWYDIAQNDLGKRVDEEGIRRSANQMAELLDSDLVAPFGPRRTLLAGFSQGGVIALHLGLRRRVPLAGIIALSTYAPTAEYLPQEGVEACRSTPVFWGHGSMDPVVPVELARPGLEALRSWGCEPLWKTYPMPHSVCAQELADLSHWIVGLLADRA